MVALVLIGTFDWIISDGSTDKIILGYKAFSTATVVKDTIPYDFLLLN